MSRASEKRGYQIYDPKDQKLLPLDAEGEHSGLTTVKQELYDWAKRGAQPDYQNLGLKM